MILKRIAQAEEILKHQLQRYLDLELFQPMILRAGAAIRLHQEQEDDKWVAKSSVWLSMSKLDIVVLNYFYLALNLRVKSWVYLLKHHLS